MTPERGARGGLTDLDSFDDNISDDGLSVWLLYSGGWRVVLQKGNAVGVVAIDAAGKVQEKS